MRSGEGNLAGVGVAGARFGSAAMSRVRRRIASHIAPIALDVVAHQRPWGFCSAGALPATGAAESSPYAVPPSPV